MNKDTKEINDLSNASEVYLNILIKEIKIPVLYGFKSIYKVSKRNCTRKRRQNEINKEFQKLLKSILHWSDTTLNTATEEIIKKVDNFKSLMTAIFVAKAEILSKIKITEHKNKIKIEIPTVSRFVHQIYIKSAENFFYSTELFDEHVEPSIRKSNIKRIYRVILESIKDTVNDMIPYKNILQDNIGEYFEDSDSDASVVDEPPLDKISMEKQTATLPNTDKMIRGHHPVGAADSFGGTHRESADSFGGTHRESADSFGGTHRPVGAEPLNFHSSDLDKPKVPTYIHLRPKPNKSNNDPRGSFGAASPDFSSDSEQEVNESESDDKESDNESVRSAEYDDKESDNESVRSAENKESDNESQSPEGGEAGSNAQVSKKDSNYMIQESDSEDETEHQRESDVPLRASPSARAGTSRSETPTHRPVGAADTAERRNLRFHPIGGTPRDNPPPSANSGSFQNSTTDIYKKYNFGFNQFKKS